jgi:hypothetical protein
MEELYVDAGCREIRGVQRACRILLEVSNGRRTRAKLVTAIPDGAITIQVTYQSFRGLMHRYGLSFRRRVYETDEERMAAKRDSLKRYRASDKYRQRQASRRKQKPGMQGLTDAHREEIRRSVLPPTRLAQLYNLSLRQVHGIKTEGSSDNE